MRKIYVIYKQAEKIKKAVLDENMHKAYTANPEIESLTEYENETLMEKAYAEKVGKVSSKKKLFD
jgi:hypothetical protein